MRLCVGPDPSRGDASCRPHSGFAPDDLRQHLNTWRAHGHKLKPLFGSLPSSSLLVCVELGKRICLESQNSWENVNSHTPLSLGLACAFSLLSEETVCSGPILGSGLLVQALLFLSG